MIKTYEELDIWKLGIDLVENIYHVSKTFPKAEQYNLTSQLRRSAVSVPSNIAEGSSRSSNKEFVQFLYISLGSLAELDTQIVMCGRLKYIENTETLRISTNNLRKKILNFIKHLKKQ